MDVNYNVTVTFEELQSILTQEFGVSDEHAKVASVLLIQNQKSDDEVMHQQIKEEARLFLGGNSEKVQTHIFSTRYTVCFTDAMLEIIDNSIVPVILALIGKEELGVLSELFQGIKALIKNCRKITDSECCVYYLALQFLKDHSTKYFSADEVKPELASDKICINLDKKWNCKFKTGVDHEKCGLTSEDVVEILKVLCDDKVLESSDGRLYSFRT